MRIMTLKVVVYYVYLQVFGLEQLIYYFRYRLFRRFLMDLVEMLHSREDNIVIILS